MYKRQDILLIVACILFLVFPHHAGAEKNLSPVKNSGNKWRIGYFQGSEYYEYPQLLKGLVRSLINLNWIEPCEIPDGKNANNLWKWLSKNVKSDYIEFIDDAFWSSDKEKESCDANHEDIYKRAVKEKYIDLMISMGTVAGACLSQQKEYNVNTMVMCASNPVYSKIVKNIDEYPKSPKYSGIDYIHAIIRKDEFLNEIALFYRLVKFKRLGVVYGDTEPGKAKAAIEFLEKNEKKQGFNLITEKIYTECIDENCPKEVLLEKYKKLIEEDKVDAVYMVEHLEEEKDGNISFLKKLLEPMFKHKVATWSQTPRTWMVKYGVLMSLNGADPADIGMFEANVMAQILRGKKPGEISQLFVNPKNEAITLNLETAQKIQLDLRWEALATAEKIYEKTCKDIKDNSCEKEE
jgi:ABC-type uncharacterized transport system substrate-binding protein